MKKILITGCSSGFGYDAAKYLAEKGHYVYATMRNIKGKNANSASELIDYASSNGVKIEVLEMDVTSDESVSSAVSKIADVDVLINNAGLGFKYCWNNACGQSCFAGYACKKVRINYSG